MEKTNRLFIVSFGDSRKYRMEYADALDPHALVHSAPFTEIENELNEYLKKEFPDETFAYYTSPKVTEVDWEHRDKYASYPVLDAAAIDSIKKLLAKEVRDMNANKTLNNNAPYADAPV
ncbi:MAG: hypothetical protein HDS67_05180 [Bacteroidales bacterium]|nr:hypothetical protein [Bacteroidales bacterium]